VLGGVNALRWSRVRSRIPQVSFWRSVGIVAGGAAFAQTLSLLAAPILTRLYSPAEFGTFALYLSILLVLVAVGTLRYEQAIPLPEDDTDALHVLAFGLAVALAVSMLLGVAIALGAGDLLAETPLSALRPYLWLGPIALLLASAYQCMTHWAMRRRAFDEIAKTRIIQGIGKTTTQVALGALGAGPLGLMLGDAVGRGGGSGSLARLAWRGSREAISAIRPSGVLRLADRYRRFAAMSTGSALLQVGAMQVPPLLLSLSFTIEVVGWYSLAQQVVFLPIGLISYSTAQVYAGEAPRAAREGAGSLRRVFLKTASGLALIAAVPAVLLAGLAPFAFSLVFGEEWTEAGIIAQLMTPVFFFSFAVAPLTYTLNVLGALNWLLFWSCLRFAMVVAALLLVPALGGSAEQTIIAYSAALTATYVGLFLLCLRQIGKDLPAEEVRTPREGS